MEGNCENWEDVILVRVNPVNSVTESIQTPTIS